MDTTKTGFHGAPVSGVEYVTPDAAAAELITAVFEAWRARQPSEIRRREFRWEDMLGLRPNAWGPTWKGWLVVHRDASGEADGYVRFHAEEKFVDRQPASTLLVDELHALTDEAYATLWRFLARSISSPASGPRAGARARACLAAHQRPRREPARGG